MAFHSDGYNMCEIYVMYCTYLVKTSWEWNAVSTGVKSVVPFGVHLSAEVDLEVVCVVQHIEESTALIELGDAAGER